MKKDGSVSIIINLKPLCCVENRLKRMISEWLVCVCGGVRLWCRLAVLFNAEKVFGGSILKVLCSGVVVVVVVVKMDGSNIEGVSNSIESKSSSHNSNSSSSSSIYATVLQNMSVIHVPSSLMGQGRRAGNTHHQF